MNCTEDPSRSSEIHYRSPFPFWTLGVITVILSVIADAGNLINLFVLTRRHMRSTMTTLLVTLAWADLVPPTVVSINNILFYYFLPNMNNSSTFLTVYIIGRSVFTALANTFTSFSNWLIVLITTFRLIVVKKPLVAKHYCNRRSARYAIVAILILSIFVNLPLFLFSSIKMSCTNNGSTKYYGLAMSTFVKTKFFTSLFYPATVAISLLIPWLICFLIWLFLIRALRSAQSQLPNKTINTTFGNDRKQDTYFRITLMIVCVLTVYMICRGPHLLEVIHILLSSFVNREKLVYLNNIRLKLFCISNIMLTINHGANFYIYSINPKFRLTLKLYLTYYFRRCRMKRRRAFTLFHLRRKRTNDSLDGLSAQHDINRSVLLRSSNQHQTKCVNNNNKKSNIVMESERISYNNCGSNALRTPQKYLRQLMEINSNNENSERSNVWKEIERQFENQRSSFR